jgi:hypothetical protein
MDFKSIEIYRLVYGFLFFVIFISCHKSLHTVVIKPWPIWCAISKINKLNNEKQRGAGFCIEWVGSSPCTDRGLCFQCCESGSGIPFWPRDPGWVKNQDSDPGPGSGRNIPDGTSRIIYRELRNNFLGLNRWYGTLPYLNCLIRIRIRDPEAFWSWIRDSDGTNSDTG